MWDTQRAVVVRGFVVLTRPEIREGVEQSWQLIPQLIQQLVVQDYSWQLVHRTTQDGSMYYRLPRTLVPGTGALVLH